MSSGDSTTNSIRHRSGTNSLLFHPVDDAIDTNDRKGYFIPDHWKRDERHSQKSDHSDVFDPLHAGQIIRTASHDHRLGKQRGNYNPRMREATSGPEYSESVDRDLVRAQGAEENKAGEPFLMETLFESLKCKSKCYELHSCC